jgi:hypothetical protein
LRISSTLAYCRLNDLKNVGEVINYCKKSIKRRGCHVCLFLNIGYSEFKGITGLLLCIADVNDAKRCELESFTCQQDNSQASCPDLLFVKSFPNRVNECCIIELKLDVETTNELKLKEHLEKVERKRDCADKLINDHCCSSSRKVIVFKSEEVAGRIISSKELKRLIRGWEITIMVSNKTGKVLDVCFGKSSIGR